ncbi:MAG TPA: transglycosylase SLT domain-containing protein [Candidatus Magasanikbacteria bacterium]|nr:transglycosylase SLT domain-containing protein [Candidatus Magasanikbacteria bacterium]
MKNISKNSQEGKESSKIVYFGLILAIIFTLVNPFYIDIARSEVKNYSILTNKEVILPVFSQKNKLSDYTPVVLSEIKIAQTDKAKALLATKTEKDLENAQDKTFIVGTETKVVRLAMNSNNMIDLDSAQREALAQEEEMKAWVLGEIAKAGLNTKEAEIIITCESRWKPDAIGVNKNGSYDVGLWQINSIHKNISNAGKMDYKEATKWAIDKRLKDGSWRAWSCSRKLK